MPWHPSPDASSSQTQVHNRRRVVKLEDEQIDLNDMPPTPSSTQSPGPVSEQRIQLDPMQELALKAILEGRNVFMTGGAGTGKSVVLRTAAAIQQSQGKHVRKCGPTGMAAHNIGGTTIHTLLGLDKDEGRESMLDLEDRAANDPLQGRLATTDVIYIDEISMVSTSFFDRMNRMFQVARDGDRAMEADDEAFGGIQIVVSGDFFQLPPVLPFENCATCGYETKRKYRNKVKFWVCTNPICDEQFEDSKQFAFDSAVWPYAGFTYIKLEENHRQNEGRWIEILNKIRVGHSLTPAELDLIENHPTDCKDAASLHAKREQVKEENDRARKRLTGEEFVYNCVDNFTMQPGHNNLIDLRERSADKITLKALATSNYSPVVKFKLGERVILTTNLDVEKGAVNGTMGVIVAFELCNPATMSSIRNSNNEIDVSQYAPADGSGRTDLGTVCLRGGTHHSYRLERMKEFASQISGELLPVVRFDNGLKRMIYPDVSISPVGDSHPYSLLSRTQIPLLSGYAMTIHKSQGLTMPKVNVYIDQCFAKGQSYTAMSRGETLAGTRIFGARKGLGNVGVNTRVKAFMQNATWYNGE